MPSPIAHLSVGYAIYRIYKRSLLGDSLSPWLLPLQTLIAMSLSMLPDLDTILAVILGDMQKYHNNFSHSFLFALPVALLCAGLFSIFFRSNFWVWFLICLLSYEFHVIMDFFTAERGVMLFWPFTDARFASPVKLFFGLQWGLGWFSVWHLWTIFTEGLFAVLVIYLVHFVDKRRTRMVEVINETGEW